MGMQYLSGRKLRSPRNVLASPAFETDPDQALRTIAFDKDGLGTTAASELFACAVIDSDNRLGRALDQERPGSVFHFSCSQPVSELRCCLNTRIC